LLAKLNNNNNKKNACASYSLFFNAIDMVKGVLQTTIYRSQNNTNNLEIILNFATKYRGKIKVKFLGKFIRKLNNTNETNETNETNDDNDNDNDNNDDDSNDDDDNYNDADDDVD